jgi:hypothetical protein
MLQHPDETRLKRRDENGRARISPLGSPRVASPGLYQVDVPSPRLMWMDVASSGHIPVDVASPRHFLEDVASPRSLPVDVPSRRNPSGDEWQQTTGLHAGVSTMASTAEFAGNSTPYANQRSHSDPLDLMLLPTFADEVGWLNVCIYVRMYIMI